MHRLMIFILAASFAVACGKKGDSENKPGPAEKVTEETPAPVEPETPTPAEVPAEAVPTAEDFEAEAVEAIDEKAVEKELEALEKELDD